MDLDQKSHSDIFLLIILWSPSSCRLEEVVWLGHHVVTPQPAQFDSY